MDASKINRYQKLIEKIFFDGYQKNLTSIPFERIAFEEAAESLDIKLPKNLGDIIYSIRYRTKFPEKIVRTQPKGMEWIIEGAGRAKYCFSLVKVNRIKPNPDLITIKIPDATPEIITAYAMSDEQALLAKIRYNRLIDIFLGLTAYSLQNHLRTTVPNIGQIEIDEVYTAIDRNGCHYILPVQAKGGTDELSVVQSKQDIAFCRDKFPHLVSRAVSAQFMDDDLIAMFEIVVEDDQVRVADEKHYRLVPSDEITRDDLRMYSVRG